MPAPESILIIKPGSLGDIVHAMPALGYISKTWPTTKITWIVDSRWVPLLENVEHLHAIIKFPREDFRGPGGWARSVSWFRSLRDLQPNLVIDLQGLMRSALMARASGGQLVVGGSDAREGACWFYQMHAQVDPAFHAVERYRAIVAAAGLDTSSEPEFPLAMGEPPDADLPDSFFLLHPFARGNGKSLECDVAASIAEALQPHCVVLAGVGEMTAKLPKNAINLLNRTSLAHCIWLSRRACHVVSVDSGPAHIAAAVNPHVLAIHTWSDPRRVGPYSQSAYVWQGGEIRPQNLDPHAKLPTGRNFEAADVRCLANWLHSRNSAS
jgi:heptosyltransferase-1